MALRRVLRWGLMLGALGWTAYQLPPLVRAAGAEAGVLSTLSWGWAVAAAVFGLVAVALYAELHRQLLAVGGARPPAASVQSITFAQNAIGNTVPVVGGAGAMAYAVTRLRNRGVDTGLATCAVLLAGVLSFFVLVVLGVGALAATGVLPLTAAALACAGVAAAAAAAWWLVTHPAGLRSVSARLHLVRPSPRQWLRLLVLAALTWLLDFANLAVASAAVPGSLHWAALVQGFLVVQASIALQVLPGGAGLAEVGLLGALLGSGVAAGPAAAVVLIYRTTSWLLPSLLGWLAYGGRVGSRTSEVGEVTRTARGRASSAPGASVRPCPTSGPRSVALRSSTCGPTRSGPPFASSWAGAATTRR